MEIITLVLVLLFVTSATGVIARFVPVLPIPLMQIAIGALLAWPVHGIHVSLQPELFLLLFIAPLLYADARRFPQRELMALRSPILTLAFGLVLFTVLGVGYLIHWMLPVISLPIAFALAAVLSPTDAVAVTAISGRLPIPRSLLRVLEGESLMNDASGLVAFNFAVAAALTGTFSLGQASISFVIVALGGAILGGSCAWLLSFIRAKLIDQSNHEASATQIILFQLVLPFMVYLAAQRLHVSGILAAVAAGLVITRTDLRHPNQLQTRLKTRNMWEIIEFVLSSLVFLLLGFQLPTIIQSAFNYSLHNTHQYELIHLFIYVVIITAALLLSRFIWIFCALLLARLVAKLKKRPLSRFPMRLILISTFAGVRGTITLAAALSLPHFLNNGSLFPNRELIIFIATGVILLTLIGGSIVLPIMLKGLHILPDTRLDEEEARARDAAAAAAIHRIEEYRQQRVDEIHQEIVDEGEKTNFDEDDRIVVFAELTTQLMNVYQERLLDHDENNEIRRSEYAQQAWRELSLQALHAERAEYYRQRRRNRINDVLFRKLVRETDLNEMALLVHREKEEY